MSAILFISFINKIPFSDNKIIRKLLKKRKDDSALEFIHQVDGSSAFYNKEDDKVGILSKGIQEIPNLQSFLKCEVIFNPGNDDQLTYIAGWGMKPSAKKALAYSKRNNTPYLGLEDGFLRSTGLGVEGSTPLSMCIDNRGIYYDATKPSLLEDILNSSGWETADLVNDAKNAISLIKANYLSKYNHAPMADETIFTGKKRILIVDQTLGDMSITLGLANNKRFLEMYETAKIENPDAQLFIKTHPDVISGKKEGNLLPEHVDAKFIYDDCNPLSLLEKVDKVYVVTSQLGFEALMLGKEVHCFGMPFYAGWGITKDRLTVDRRKKVRSMEEIFAAAYILYTRYINPYDGSPGTIFDVIRYLTEYKKTQHCVEIDDKNNVY